MLRTICLAVAFPLLALPACARSESSELDATQSDSEAEPESSSDPRAAAFAGRYRFTGGEKERAARDAAIDDVVSSMNMLSRGVARGRLADTNPIAQSLLIEPRNGQLTIALDDRRYTAPMNGSAVKVKGITGDPMTLELRVGTEIEQAFSGDERGRTNTYVLRDGALVLKVRVHAEALPKELAYELTYRKE